MGPHHRLSRDLRGPVVGQGRQDASEQSPAGRTESADALLARAMSWQNTTHDWTATVDIEHLRSIREAPEAFAGSGVLHLVLEVLAYAWDEAVSRGSGRVLVELHPDESRCRAIQVWPTASYRHYPSPARFRALVLVAGSAVRDVPRHHGSVRAALIYQHATSEHGREIAEALGLWSRLAGEVPNCTPIERQARNAPHSVRLGCDACV